MRSDPDNPRSPVPVLALFLVAASCTRASAPLPPGLLVRGRAADASTLLGTLAGWSGTPLANAAGAARATLGRCPDRFSLRQEGNAPASLDCADDPALSALPEGHALAFALPEAGPGRLVGWVDLGSSTVAEGTLDDPDTSGAWGLVLPSEDGPGPLRLSDEGELFHARDRASRLSGLSDLVASGGQGDSMFGLRSDLFAGAILDGTWEFAIYLPAEDGKLPRAALSVGVRDEEVARRAFHAWLEKVQRTWNIKLTTGIPGLEGCFQDYNTLPDLAPCAAIADHAITVGWNRASLDHALAHPAGTPVEGALARLEMARLPEADRLLSLAFAPDEAPPRIPYPWSRVQLQARQVEDSLRVRLELSAP